MVIEWRNARYEMALNDTLLFYIRRSWFRRRRLLRAGKRCMLRFKAWALALILFIAICMVLFSCAVFAGIASWNEVLFGLLSVSLGSFALLFLKETMIRKSKGRYPLRSSGFAVLNTVLPPWIP